MKSKRTARIIAVVLALLMVFSIIWVAIDALSAKAIVTQAEIDKLREEKKDYEKRKQEIQSRINTIEFERMAEVAKKSVLDDRIILTGMEIDNINSTIDLYNELIIDKEREVGEAINREDAQLRKYMMRVRDMEENGIISYLEIIFDSTSFSDLLARLDFVGDIMQADEMMYNNLIKAREDTIIAKENLEITVQEKEAEKVLLEKKVDELNGQLDEASELISSIEATLETESELYAVESAEADRIQKEINTKVEELRKQEAAAAAASRVRGTGQLLWPCPSASYVSEGFGVRLHPVYNVYRQHWGVDIPANYGVSIIAADSGTVIISEYNSSYGNYVVINHGNGMTTLYAHMSSRGVSVGQSVSKGQIIGYVGTTGVSTGPHLHFEVSVDGNKVDPEKYL
ncbi:MAG: peptidoglycan DD-metalloendopeptidase family protein [Oscillospiraceae bacterium]|nr:peptidoglycan DD-metalloendopeptidase family protein [Oscillospiraceae bacterium]